jgi:hypothetical protein
MCPLLAQLIIGFFFLFFLLQLFAVLMKQTRQAVRAIKQSIFLDVYDYYPTPPFTFVKVFKGLSRIFERMFFALNNF